MIELPQIYQDVGTRIALSIRQPWAWLIVNRYKNIENRTWAHRRRGWILIHAAKGLTVAEYQGAALFALRRGVQVPPMQALERGGLVGAAEITGCVHRSASPWFEGPHGFELRNAIRLPFVPCMGALGFFEVRR